MFKNPVKNGLRLMRSNSRAIHRAYGASDSRTLHLAGISVPLGWCWHATVPWRVRSGHRMPDSSTAITAGRG